MPTSFSRKRDFRQETLHIFSKIFGSLSEAMAEAVKETAKKAFSGVLRQKPGTVALPYWRRVKNIVAIGRNYAYTIPIVD